MEVVRLTEGQVQGLRWEVVELTEDFRRSRAVYGQGPKGPVYAYRTEVFAPDQFLEANQTERNETEGTRWDAGLGSDKNGNLPMVKVSSIPLNVFYRDFAGRHGDQDFKKWYLNLPENEAFRTRKGKL
jgi:hypothetical protein